MLKNNVIFIVGSKPDAIFPEIKPNLIIAANASIKRVQNYYGKTKIIGILSDQIFSNNDCVGEDGFLEKNRQYIKDSNIDNLVLLKTLPKSKYVAKVEDIINIGSPKIKVLNRWQYVKLIINYVGFLNSFLYMLKTYKIYEIIKTLYQTLRYGKYNPAEVSTGMICLAYAINNFKYSKIYVIGIGIEKDSGYSFTSKARYNIFHIDKDLFFVRSLLKNKIFKNIVFTDKYFNKKINEMKKKI